MATGENIVHANKEFLFTSESVTEGPAIEPFIYGSEEFETELRDEPHLAGEIGFLRSIARPGMNALDVGAHRGVTTVALAKSVGPAGHVYAFEPVPEYCDAARENLSRNRVKNAEIFELALGDRKERFRFHKRGGSSGIVQGEDEEILMVEATTVANFLAQRNVYRIDVRSMDCEGSELRVLQGAESLLQEQTPQIFCEIHHDYLESLGQSAGDVATYLEDLAYRVQPIFIEAPGTKPALDECSHIYARLSDQWTVIKELERKIRNLKGRMPAHSMQPSMLQEFEELEEQLQEAKKKVS
ncbi:MAG: FkbM family methyltransferase [Deltaproteobacteria bacterium]|nr:FkbM family methyltransferase [Deltaproteobacteria bacterium]